jgi:Circadian oscillating protein COP23
MAKKSWLAMIIVGSIALIQTELPAEAQTSTFYCDTSGSVPITRIRTRGRGDESFIQWKTSFSRGYSAAKRCKQVAARFERQHLRGRLYLTSRSNINGHPVICYADSENGACNSGNILVTLRRGIDHRNALLRFNAFPRRSSNRPIELSGDPKDESTPLELSGGSNEESTPLELAGNRDNANMPPLELSGDPNWSQNDSGELYYDLSAAVNAKRIAPK